MRKLLLLGCDFAKKSKCYQKNLYQTLTELSKGLIQNVKMVSETA